ncbi:MAG: aminoacyl-tRNA hydrolase [Actinomycetia bacterium]|nr:aminoacyl-tRNA hydrolase [Actinomycetes bacterium]
MIAFIGLGNPGDEYKNNRHNLGCMAIDILSERYNIAVNKIESFYVWGQGEVFGKKVFLIKPLIFVNESGRAVRDFIEKAGLEKEDIVIIYDDLDLPIGSFRVRSDGRSGGHNGLVSIINQLNSDEFKRIKIGIGRPKERGKRREADFVLTDFPKKEFEQIIDSFPSIIDEIEKLIRKG